MGLTGIHWAIIKCAVVCFAVILAVIILRVYHSSLGPSISRWYYRAYVDDAILTSLHPANLSSTTSSSSIRYQLSLNITFKTVSYGNAGYRDCSATAWYKDTMLDAPRDWNPDQGKDFTEEMKWTDITFQGTVAVYPSVAADLATEQALGTVHVRVRLSSVAMSVPSDHTAVDYNDHDCWLWFPTPGDDAAPAVFGEGTQCWPVP